MYSCGQWDNLLLEATGGKADGFDATEGSSPGCDMASKRDTTGV